MPVYQIKKDSEKVRVQVDLLPSQVATLENLMVVCGLDTRKDLVNNSLTLLEWAVEQVRLGKEVAALNREEKSYEILRMPALIAASRYSPPSNTVPMRDLASVQRKAVAEAQKDEESHASKSSTKAGDLSNGGLLRTPATL